MADGAPAMKMIYWRLVRKIIDPDGSTKFRVEYFTRLDRSNSISDVIHSLNEAQLRKRIELTLGIKKFELKRVDE